MATLGTDSPKVLGQSLPPTATLTTLYTVPLGKYAVISTLVVCNQSAYSQTFRIAVAVAGAADEGKQYLYYDQYVLANATFTATLGISLAPSDVLRCLSSSGSLSFNVFGVEVT